MCAGDGVRGVDERGVARPLLGTERFVSCGVGRAAAGVGGGGGGEQTGPI